MIRLGTQNDDLLAYWNFEDGSGSALTDIVGGNNGVIHGSPSWEDDGIFKKCLKFETAIPSEYILVAQSDSRLAPTSFTISGWIKPSTIASGSKGVIAKIPDYIIVDYGSYLRFEIFYIAGTGYDGTCNVNGLEVDKWFFYVASYDHATTTTTFYLYDEDYNLIDSDTASVTNSPTESSNSLDISAWGATRFLGEADDIHIFNRAITEIERKALCLAPGVAYPINNLTIWESLNVEQNLTSQVDSASFKYRKFGSRAWSPSVSDEIEIWDDETKIFGGTIITMNESIEAGSDGLLYNIKCVDWTYELDSYLVAESYESQTIAQIITHMVDNYATGFTYVNVESDFLIDKIVFNQVPISECLKRLANIVKYEWYIDPDKDIHFFPKFTNTAPYDLTDSSGNYIYKSLIRNIDGKQLANRVKVRGGEYDADTFEDEITVKGNITKSFKLPYRFSGLSVWLNVGAGYVAQDVGIDFINDFTTDDVLYNYNDMTIKWENPLADGDLIKFSGKPKVPVLAIASDSISIAEFGVKEKLVRDNSIEDIQTARRRAIAELEAYKDEIDDTSFKTYTSGLRTGQIINLQSTTRGSIDVNYIIRRVVFKMIDPENFGYTVGLVTTRKYGFIELLQKLLQPESMQADDNEVAEDIETDIIDLTITELIDVTLAVDTDAFDIVITEDIEKDPLGLDTEPDWVLAKYVPSPWPTDTKREGRLDYSLQVY